METPKVPPPKDAAEKEILKNLIAIRDDLQLRKQDRTTYVRTQDVMILYDKTVAQVKRLNEVRQDKQTEENQVDRVMDSCFQLLSLFFMTIGRNNEAPAAYALTSTIKRLIDHLSEAGFFSEKDLQSMSQALERLSGIVQNAHKTSSAPFLEILLSNRIERCQAELNNLKKQLEEFAEPLLVTQEKLVSILRQLAVVNTRSKFSTSDVHKLEAKLVEIDATRVDGNFVDADGKTLPGSEQVAQLLDRCRRYVAIILEHNGHFPDQFKSLYDVLIGIRNELDKLSLTQAWSLRETDLYDYQRQLDKIDESRVDGNWLDEQGRPAELYVQRTLLYLVRRSYAYIYHLMISSEPVSEALLPIYNQLQTLKRCLVEVQNSGGVASVRELYPYSMKLNSIDNMRVDGKFMVGGDIPEGQGSVAELLAECFELNYELRVAAESEGDHEGAGKAGTPKAET